MSEEPSRPQPSLSLEQTIAAWVQESGHGLEMQVAAALFPTDVSLHYLDKAEGKWRETDVIKGVTGGGPAPNVFIQYVIEVKDTSQPWVAFLGDQVFNQDHDVVKWLHKSESHAGSGNLINLHASPLLFHRGYGAYKVVKFASSKAKPGLLNAAQDKNARNEARDAVMQVLSACRGLEAEHVERQAALTDGQPRVFLWVPIVLTGGRLFTAELGEDGVAVKETEKVLLHSQFPPDGQPRAVWIVTKAYLHQLSYDVDKVPTLRF